MRTIMCASVMWLASVTMSAAAPIWYNNEAAFTASAGPLLFFLNFNGQPQGVPGSGNFPGQVDFGSPEAADPSQVFFNSFAMTDNGSTTASNGVGPIDGTFASPVSAFGLVFSSSSSPQTVEIYDSGSAIIDSAASLPGGFFGVISDTPVASFVIRNGLFPDDTRDRYFVDDFRVHAPAVPEPGTWLLVGTGLAAVRRFRTRRRAAGQGARPVP